jgi:NTP pyrophosphatase (non-canonical NTP hydrolase)
VALSVEAAELLEVFQWLSEPESREISGRQRRNAREEAADVAIYLRRLADVLDIDLTAAIKDKIRMNEKKYPVVRTRGNAKKYTDFDQ